jgi:anti-sigma factor RsiW
VDDRPLERLLRDVTRLADGSLPSPRRAAVQAQIDASPELARILAEQRRVVHVVRAAAVEVRAPAHVRRQIQTDLSARSSDQRGDVPAPRTPPDQQ